jgi:carboxyl-terminal processing protease
MRTLWRGAPRTSRPVLLVGAALLALTAACGSSGSPASQSPASQYAALCATPRTGTDPQTRAPYPDRPGTAADEKAWLRAWTDDLYLWYREVPVLDPAAYATPVAYFGALKTPALTGSGRPKDRFHFTYSTADWLALSGSGVEAGYGVTWSLLSASPPRQIVAAFVEAGSPAAAAGIVRGTQVFTVDGVDVALGTDVATLNEGLFPPAPGATHRLEIGDSLGPRTVTVTSAAITGTAVPTVRTLSTGTGAVGYVLFNAHMAPAEAQLVAAFQQLEAAAVSDLVLDLRYNGGGYLAVASEAAFMVAGPARTAGKVFERQVFNDKAGSSDPITGQPNQPVPFYGAALGLSTAAGTPLPSLGLGRVFVLTGPGTCSASESVMNGLRGVGIQVIQIGATTCGKPYGFYPEDNCGTTYFSIQFGGANQQGFGDYGDGFVPGGTGVNGVPGCAVADDLGHALGDPAEGRLAAALGYRATGTCPPAAAGAALQASRPVADGNEVTPPPWRQSRILTR